MLDHNEEMNFKFKEYQKFYKFHVLKCNNNLESVFKTQNMLSRKLKTISLNFFEIKYMYKL